MPQDELIRGWFEGIVADWVSGGHRWIKTTVAGEGRNVFTIQAGGVQ